MSETVVVKSFEEFHRWLDKFLDESMERADYSFELEGLADRAVENAIQSFEGEHDPAGHPWPEWRSGTSDKVFNRPDEKTLHDSGDLEEAAIGGAGNLYSVSEREMIYGVSADAIPYAKVHDEGGVATATKTLRSRDRRAITHRPGDPVVIFERKFIGLTEAQIDAACEEIADRLIQTMRET